MKRIPLWIKLAYTAFLVTWIGYYVYKLTDDPTRVEHLVWFCYVGLMVLGLGLWLDSSLLVSWQAVSLVAVQLVFTLDVMARLITGSHIVSGWTEYMFSPNVDFVHRLLSWFHTPMPFLLLYAVWRLGYDRRAVWFQTVAAAVLLLLAFFFTEPWRNINFAHGPGKGAQTWVQPWVYLLFCMVAYPLVIYLPTHLLLLLLMPRRLQVKPVPSPEVAAMPQHDQIDGQGNGHVYKGAQPDRTSL